MAIFNGTEGEPIELSQAAAWTANYRNAEAEKSAETVIEAHFFGHEILQKLLNQEGCVGIRIYYALDNDGQKQLVLVGVDAEGNDIEELVLDGSRVCPPNCSKGGNLNG